MVKQTTSFWERLKICWSVLTKHNYVYFGIGKDPIIWNEDGSYKEINKDAIKAYCYITYNYKFDTNTGVENLHDFMWNTIEKMAKEAQNGKF